MRAGRIVLVVVVVTIVAGAGAAYWLGASVPQVMAAKPVRGPAVQAVYATGNVEAAYWAKVTPFAKGRIEEICACEGKKVERGEILARLDDREMRAQLNELKARETFLAEELKRYSRLLERRVISEKSYESAASERAQVLSAIAGAKERLDQRVLRSPMDGVVLRRDGEVGEVVQPGEILFWVGKPRPLRITAEVDEEDIPLVKIGLRALLKADAFPDKVLEGQVDQITPKGDPTNKSYRVRIALPDDTPLMMGMTTEINIVVHEVPDALLIPATAVRNRQVWVVAGGKARRKQVQVGIAGDARIQILSGLGENDLVINNPPAGLVDGARVRALGAGAVR